jgi:hypothetical protein
MRSSLLAAVTLCLLPSGCYEETIPLDTLTEDTGTREEDIDTREEDTGTREEPPSSCDGELNDAGECVDGTTQESSDEHRDDRYDREGEDSSWYDDDSQECAWLWKQLQDCFREMGENHEICMKDAAEFEEICRHTEE